jgi:hypothetical protein
MHIFVCQNYLPKSGINDKKLGQSLIYNLQHVNIITKENIFTASIAIDFCVILITHIHLLVKNIVFFGVDKFSSSIAIEKNNYGSYFFLYQHCTEKSFLIT